MMETRPEWVPKMESMCGMCSVGHRTFSASEITCSMRQCTMHQVELCRSSAIYYLTVGFLVTDNTPPAQLTMVWLHAIVLSAQIHSKRTSFVARKWNDGIFKVFDSCWTFATIFSFEIRRKKYPSFKTNPFVNSHSSNFVLNGEGGAAASLDRIE